MSHAFTVSPTNGCSEVKVTKVTENVIEPTAGGFGQTTGLSRQLQFCPEGHADAHWLVQLYHAV